MANINLDEPFEQIIYEKILPSVADAFCQLAAKLSLCHMSENAIDELLKRKANLLKCATTHYIDSQAKILKANLRMNNPHLKKGAYPMTNNFKDAVADLALPQIERFFQDPQNQADFEKWLATRDEKVWGKASQAI